MPIFFSYRASSIFCFFISWKAEYCFSFFYFLYHCKYCILLYLEPILADWQQLCWHMVLCVAHNCLFKNLLFYSCIPLVRMSQMDVTLSGCQTVWMSHFLDVTCSGCHNFCVSHILWSEWG
jgi:hypothetical protein